MALFGVNAAKYRVAVEQAEELRRRIAAVEQESQAQLAEALSGLTDVLPTAAYNVYKMQTTQASGIQLDDDMRTAQQQVDGLVAASEEISASIVEVNDNMERLAEEFATLERSLNDGSAAVGTAEGEMESIDNRVQELESTVTGLRQRIQEIVGVVEVIQGIAEQTNLLALNAAIEAARAGEAGRGFAVVAEEVRKLADETRRQSEGITKSIQEVTRDIEATVELTGASVESVAAGRDANNQIKDAFEQIVTGAGVIGEMTSHTQAQLEEQRAATELIVQNSEALASLIGNTANVADYVRQTAERCAADAQQVWRALMGVEDSDRVFILDRIIDHANWLNKLAVAVTSGNTSDELANHRNCKLGKWYFSPAGQEIRNRGGRTTALFDQLDEPHQRLHDTGLAAIAAARKGNTEEAQNLMLKAFEESVTVVDLLVSLAVEL